MMLVSKLILHLARVPNVLFGEKKNPDETYWIGVYMIKNFKLTRICFSRLKPN